MGTEKLSRGSVRDSLKQTTVSINAYPSIASFTTNEESVLGRRLDYDVNPDSTVLTFIELPVLPTFDTDGTEITRRSLKQSSDLLAFTETVAFGSSGVPTSRIVLPVLSDIDDVQIIVRSGAFDLDFSGEPRIGLPPHGVEFENKSLSPIESWTWDFGDGNTSNEREPFHIYLDEGLYTVRLTAGASVYGFASITKVDYINVGVLLIIDPTSGEAPLKVSFAVDERILT